MTKTRSALVFASLILVLFILSPPSGGEEGDRSGWSKFFTRFRENFDDFPLHTAVRLGHAEDVRRLIEEGADPAALDEDAFAPLHFAAWKGEVEIARILIDAGAQIDVHRRPYGETPLLLAIHHERIDMVKYLLERGADCRATNFLDQSPLSFAAQVGNVEALSLLLESGAEVDQAMEDGRTPLFIAVSTGQIEAATRLIEFGADLEAESRSGHTPLYAAVFYGQTEMVSLLLEAREVYDGDYLNTQGLLISAVSQGHREVVENLLEAGADPNWRYDSESNEALHLACKLGHKGIAESLIRHGAILDATNWRDMTPLHYALLGEHCRIANLLIEKGADTGAVDLYGMTADQFADLVRTSKGRELIPSPEEGGSYDPRAV
ncbi:MAG: ankyrin repeat domain-containing protein, partial [Candidatus Omnitrophica bacterium]|nr:ankyrin repeat domain-containing protein [Candidatus Omnitrophota bacterium]